MLFANENQCFRYAPQLRGLLDFGRLQAILKARPRSLRRHLRFRDPMHEPQDFDRPPRLRLNPLHLFHLHRHFRGRLRVAHYRRLFVPK